MKNYKEASWIGHLAIKKEHVKSLILLMKSQEEVSKDLVSCDAFFSLIFVVIQ